MKSFIFTLLMMISGVAEAESLDEIVLSNAQNTCKIYYLTTKQKKLWTIDVDSALCKDGWVDGFATVSVKDPLNRLVETLHGYFFNGHWFLEYPGNITTFQRTNPQTNTQSFIFQAAQEPDLELTYYAVARTTRPKDSVYSGFRLCSERPVFLVAHDPIGDFQQSLFQSTTLKNAKKLLPKLCPKSKQFELLGVSPQNPTDTNWTFQAIVDLENDENTLKYNTQHAGRNIPMPTELRHEDGEKLLTIQPQSEGTTKTLYGEQPLPTEEIETIFIPESEPAKSAFDLALLARVKATDVRGRAMIHIDNVSLDETISVDLPVPLTAKGDAKLTPGWYMATGLFRNEDGKDFIQILSAKPCLKDWCPDEK
ncbi:MAG: hypothetical protein II942_04865 [Alphaproteobacteria bacterium]|nr:hypothetical protein [Alphaproteobacteria bacterium]